MLKYKQRQNAFSFKGFSHFYPVGHARVGPFFTGDKTQNLQGILGNSET